MSGGPFAVRGSNAQKKAAAIAERTHTALATPQITAPSASQAHQAVADADLHAAIQAALQCIRAEAAEVNRLVMCHDETLKRQLAERKDLEEQLQGLWQCRHKLVQRMRDAAAQAKVSEKARCSQRLALDAASSSSSSIPQRQRDPCALKSSRAVHTSSSSTVEPFIPSQRLTSAPVTHSTMLVFSSSMASQPVGHQSEIVTPGMADATRTCSMSMCQCRPPVPSAHDARCADQQALGTPMLQDPDQFPTQKSRRRPKPGSAELWITNGFRETNSEELPAECREAELPARSKQPSIQTVPNITQCVNGHTSAATDCAARHTLDGCARMCSTSKLSLDHMPSMSSMSGIPQRVPLLAPPAGTGVRVGAAPCTNAASESGKAKSALPSRENVSLDHTRDALSKSELSAVLAAPSKPAMLCASSQSADACCTAAEVGVEAAGCQSASTTAGSECACSEGCEAALSEQNPWQDVVGCGSGSGNGVAAIFVDVGSLVFELMETDICEPKVLDQRHETPSDPEPCLGSVFFPNSPVPDRPPMVHALYEPWQQHQFTVVSQHVVASR